AAQLPPAPPSARHPLPHAPPAPHPPATILVLPGASQADTSRVPGAGQTMESVYLLHPDLPRDWKRGDPVYRDEEGPRGDDETRSCPGGQAERVGGEGAEWA